jgi:ArsR family transcriptional regulator, arsenate/arsenite/antimonite-responsive transcriptional repressor
MKEKCMAPYSIRKCYETLGDPVSDQDVRRLAAICKALAHPARIAIVTHLKKLNRCVCGQIVDALPLAQSTVSQHLKILKSVGVVRGEIEGPRTCYCLNPDVLDELKILIGYL